MKHSLKDPIHSSKNSQKDNVKQRTRRSWRIFLGVTLTLLFMMIHHRYTTLHTAVQQQQARLEAVEKYLATPQPSSESSYLSKNPISSRWLLQMLWLRLQVIHLEWRSFHSDNDFLLAWGPWWKAWENMSDPLLKKGFLLAQQERKAIRWVPEFSFEALQYAIMHARLRVHVEAYALLPVIPSGYDKTTRWLQDTLGVQWFIDSESAVQKKPVPVCLAPTRDRLSWMVWQAERAWYDQRDKDFLSWIDRVMQLSQSCLAHDNYRRQIRTRLIRARQQLIAMPPFPFKQTEDYLKNLQHMWGKP